MKNEQIMIYVLLAILYGAVGWLLYSMYEKKENYTQEQEQEMEQHMKNLVQNHNREYPPLPPPYRQ